MSNPFQGEQRVAEQTKNAKILQRKQIEKRLVGLKSEQYQKIASNLKMQNEKLRSQVKLLNEKVQELVQSRKISKKQSPQVEQEIARLKRELDLKYESMGHLKETVLRAKQNDMTEEMRLKIQEYCNIVMKCEREFKETETKREELKATIEKNEEDLKEFLPSNESDIKMDSLRIENKELKGRINRIKEELTEQEKSSKVAISKIYELKDSEKRGLVRSSSQITASLREIKSVSLIEINELEREITNLKLKKKECEKDQVTDKIIKQAKKAKLEKEIKEGLDAHKELYKKRVKGINQLNLYECKELELKHQMQRTSEVVVRNYQAGEAQTEKIVPQEFRKEWIGKSEGLLFNDAEILEYRGQCLIKAVTLYKTPESIVFAKFHYESPDKKRFESQPPFQKFVLKKCEAKRYESKSQSALVGLIISIHSQTKRVVRMELKWQDGDCSIIGWDIQGSTKFPFDLSGSQRPVCMFGSVCQTGKFTYVLESIGCEVNTFDE